MLHNRDTVDGSLNFHLWSLIHDVLKSHLLIDPVSCGEDSEDHS